MKLAGQLRNPVSDKMKQIAKAGALKKSPNQMRKDISKKLASLKGY